MRVWLARNGQRQKRREPTTNSGWKFWKNDDNWVSMHMMRWWMRQPNKSHGDNKIKGECSRASVPGCYKEGLASGGGVMGGCYRCGIWRWGQGKQPLLERRQARHQPCEEHLVLRSLDCTSLQLLLDGLHLLHSLDLDFFACHRRWIWYQIGRMYYWPNPNYWKVDESKRQYSSVLYWEGSAPLYNRHDLANKPEIYSNSNTISKLTGLFPNKDV